VLDGVREWGIGWLQGYHGDDTLVSYGRGDDHLVGGGGSDTLISFGHAGSIDKLAGNGNSTKFNYDHTSDDVFIIGGDGSTIISEYDDGESIFIMDHTLAVENFSSAYDFSTDQTTFDVSFEDPNNPGQIIDLQNYLTVSGNFSVKGVEYQTLNLSPDTRVSGVHNAISDSKIILEKSTDVPSETIIGGEGDDYIIGEGGAKQIRTGGGNDTVFAGGGDDLVVIQGQGDSTVDTGTGDDTVTVTSDWSGTLLLKNGAGDNQLFVNSALESTRVDENGTLKLTLSDGSIISTEGYLEFDEVSGKHVVSEKGFYSVVFPGSMSDGEPGDLGFGDTPISLVRGSSTDDLLYSSNYNRTVDEDYHFLTMGGLGADILYGGGGKTSLFGFEGDDTFYISSESQKTVVVGDLTPSRSSNGDSELPTVATENTDFGDSVYLEWQRSEVTLSNPRDGYFRIEHAGTGSVVDIYDVEKLYFSDGSGGYEYKPLTEGQVIGKAHWQGDARWDGH